MFVFNKFLAPLGLPIQFTYMCERKQNLEPKKTFVIGQIQQDSGLLNDDQVDTTVNMNPLVSKAPV